MENQPNFEDLWGKNVEKGAGELVVKMAAA